MPPSSRSATSCSRQLRQRFLRRHLLCFFLTATAPDPSHDSLNGQLDLKDFLMIRTRFPNRLILRQTFIPFLTDLLQLRFVILHSRPGLFSTRRQQFLLQHLQGEFSAGLKPTVQVDGGNQRFERDELEFARTEKERAIQAERVHADNEMRQLRATASALREELERQRLEGLQSVQSERTVGFNEMAQLRATVGSLREALEHARAETANAVRSAIISAQAENLQLKNTIATLRDQLELQQLEKDVALRREHSLFSDENLQLHATIQALRDQLENPHSKNHG